MGKSTWFKEGKKNSQWNNATGPLPRPGKRKKIEGGGTQEQISHLCGTHPWGGTSKTNQEPANKDGGTDGIQDQGGGTSRYGTKGPVQPYQYLEGGSMLQIGLHNIYPGGGKTSQTVQGETSPMRAFVPNANLGH